MIDALLFKTASFEGTVSSAEAVTDIVEINFAAAPAVGVLEVVSMQIGIVGSSPTANEHFGFSLLTLDDAVTSGTQTNNTTTASDNVYSGFGKDNLLEDVLDYGATIVYLSDNVATTTGSTVRLFDDAWNIQIPYRQVWLPDERPTAVFGHGTGKSDAIVWRMTGQPSATLTVRGSFSYRSIGDVLWN